MSRAFPAPSARDFVPSAPEGLEGLEGPEGPEGLMIDIYFIGLIEGIAD